MFAGGKTYNPIRLPIRDDRSDECLRLCTSNIEESGAHSQDDRTPSPSGHDAIDRAHQERMFVEFASSPSPSPHKLDGSLNPASPCGQNLPLREYQSTPSIADSFWRLWGSFFPAGSSKKHTASSHLESETLWQQDQNDKEE